MSGPIDFRTRYGDQVGSQIEAIVQKLDPAVSDVPNVIERILEAFFTGRTGTLQQFDSHLIQSEPIPLRDRQVTPLNEL
jgi:hypothetical protein